MVGSGTNIFIAAFSPISKLSLETKKCNLGWLGTSQQQILWDKVDAITKVNYASAAKMNLVVCDFNIKTKDTKYAIDQSWLHAKLPKIELLGARNQPKKRWSQI